MALSAEDTALLASYRTAYGALISGTLVSEVTSGGRTVKFDKASLPKLEGEIARLEAAAANCAPVRRRGAIGFRL